MGLSPSKSKSSTTQQGTTTTTPNVPSWISDPYRNFAADVGKLGQAQVFGPNELQQQATYRAGRVGTGGQGMALVSGQDATRALLNYAPSMVSAGQLKDTNLDPYMNPYQQDVINLALNDIDMGRRGAINAGQGAATAAGAFGGSRHGVADSLTNDAAMRTMASTSANLRNTGFLNAQQAALQDINNRMTADTFNSTQGLAGANFRLNAANQLSNQGALMNQDERANIGLMSQIGAVDRAIAQENDPYTQQVRALLARAGLLNMIPADTFTGQTGTQQGTSTTTTPTGGWLGALGSAFNGIGGLNISIGGGGK